MTGQKCNILRKKGCASRVYCFLRSLFEIFVIPPPEGGGIRLFSCFLATFSENSTLTQPKIKQLQDLFPVLELFF